MSVNTLLAGGRGAAPGLRIKKVVDEDSGTQGRRLASRARGKSSVPAVPVVNIKPLAHSTHILAGTQGTRKFSRPNSTHICKLGLSSEGFEFLRRCPELAKGH